jgi:hypothetical protein
MTASIVLIAYIYCLKFPTYFRRKTSALIWTDATALLEDIMSEPKPNVSDQQAGHGCPAGADHDREIPEIDLLTPATFRGVTQHL